MTGSGLKIGIIGAGKAGTALAMGLSRAGYTVAAVASRSPASAYKLADRLPSAIAFDKPQGICEAADVVFIAVPDAAIAGTAAALTARPGMMACHVSAATPLDALEPLRVQGAITGVFHPLQAIGSRAEAEILPGITFAIEAEEPLKALLRQMASRLGGRSVELSGADRVLYHASAVMASNYLVTLVALASGLWLGFANREQAARALVPLIRGTLDNIENIGIPECLTGPIARGDTATIKLHLEALVENAPQTLDIYRELGLETIPIAAAKGGIDEGQATELRALLEKRL
ncbi:Rossmann-like and DUF2520 domain-containing protein [Dehalogenimonas alkenigignens]|uniref:DUF2520 domain-containing protein n=1 Tax=Dehalogenimonas alkenigignens TaxID=1217799 RepID=A0A0W0GJN5_9CHLR|nr:Rossmann-like and DUF2520 domain-containing protein [Dehalogenimonas alkenigignens]KTB48723.1 hypothetical protein DEALK_15700 [Dehalogenimonas alkenigignens]PVV84861.1 DUF2520 domain-containing protein [Dehalogenimonas alkenigignens]